MQTFTRLFIASLFVLASSFAQAQFSVTFRVDMSNETVGGVVSVAGNFQDEAGFPADWTPGSTVLSDGNMDGIYEATVSIPAGSYEFKYINGNAWGQDEGVPGACAVNGNRGVTVSTDTVLDAVCFGMCAPCIPPSATKYYVTWQVDMSNETVSGNGVSIAGNFQDEVGGSDWTPGVIFLTDPDTNGIYTYSDSLVAGSYQYKFLNGNAWGTDESVPGACAVSGNRGITVSSDTVIGVDCFGMCGPCPVNSGPFLVTWQVDMSKETLSGNGVSIAGNFQAAANQGNDWTPGVIFLTDPDTNGVYTFTDTLPAGAYEYKFLNGNAWGADESVPGACAVNGNRGLTLGSDTVLDMVCFARCEICCDAPSSLGYERLQDTSVRLLWDTEANATAYKIRWKPAGGSWTTAIKSTNTGMYNLTGLTASTAYKWQVQTKCGSNGWSAWTTRERFKTLSVPCVAPAGLSTSPVKADKARFNWTVAAEATTYRLRYRAQGGSWTYAIRNSDKMTFWATGLAASTTYEWQIQTWCNQDDQKGSVWSSIQTFTTTAQKQADDFVGGADAEGVFRLFPNPTSGAFTISMEAGFDEAVQVTVINSLGKVVQLQRWVPATDGQLTVTLEGAAPGVYFVRIAGNDILRNERVVVR